MTLDKIATMNIPDKKVRSLEAFITQVRQNKQPDIPSIIIKAEDVKDIGTKITTKAINIADKNNKTYFLVINSSITKQPFYSL
ncbi:MAG: hypothetical protein WC312_02485 [Candidatus Omnitrophota bacterium]|jgi:hypothetical protein